MDFKKLNEKLEKFLETSMEEIIKRAEEKKGTPIEIGTKKENGDHWWLPVFYSEEDKFYVEATSTGEKVHVENLEELLNSEEVKNLIKKDYSMVTPEDTICGMKYIPEEKVKDSLFGPSGAVCIGRVEAYFPETFQFYLHRNDPKNKEEINYHENSEDIGTIEVTYIGIEKGDNDYDTLWFHKDLDTNEYFYKSDLNDGDGFKTLKDAINSAKEECKNFNREFYKNVRFGKFEK